MGCVLLGIALVDVVVVMIMNIAYVYASFHFPVYMMVLLLIALTAFKLMWNMWCLPHWLVHHGSRLSGGAYTHTRSSSVIAHACFLIFNNVVAPCLASLVTDTSCYLTLVTSRASLDATYSFETCSKFNSTSGECESFAYAVTSTASYDPPYIYSYQCTSSLLTKYVPFFVMLYLISGVIVPAYTYYMIRTAQKSSSSLNSTSLSSWRDADMSSSRLSRMTTTVSETAFEERQTSVERSSIQLSGLRDTVARRVTRHYHHKIEALEELMRVFVFRVHQTIGNTAAAMAVMMTFGMAFPLLSILTLTQICSSTKLLEYFVRSQFLMDNTVNRNTGDAMEESAAVRVQALRDEMRSVSNIFAKSMLLATALSGCFLSWCLFDITQHFLCSVLSLTVGIGISLAFVKRCVRALYRVTESLRYRTQHHQNYASISGETAASLLHHGDVE